MAIVQYITGGLGSGKTCYATKIATDYLKQGRRVVTNLDLYPEHLLPIHSKNVNITRVPDHPGIDDFKAIGHGYDDPDSKNYDDKKFGALILDELGTWFNARKWNEKGRYEVIQWLLHARKRRWDVYLIIQDITLLDSQAEKATANQYIASCRNTGDFAIPFISFFSRLFTGKSIRFPSAQMVTIRSGLDKKAPKAEWFIFKGSNFYKGYNTRQEFFSNDDEDSQGLNSILAPYYTHGRYVQPKNADYYRQKLLKRPEFFLFANVAGFAFTFLVALILFFVKPSNSTVQAAIASVQPQQPNPVHLVDDKSTNPKTQLASEQIEPDCDYFNDLFEDAYITGSASGPTVNAYTIKTLDYETSSTRLSKQGYMVVGKNSCNLTLTDEQQCSKKLSCIVPRSVRENSPLDPGKSPLDSILEPIKTATAL